MARYKLYYDNQSHLAAISLSERFYGCSIIVYLKNSPIIVLPETVN